MADELSWTGPIPRWVQRLGEIALMAAVALAIDFRIFASAQPDGLSPGLSYAFGPVIAAALLFRRRWPLGVLAYSLAVLLVYHVTGNPGMSPVLALAVPVHFAAYAGRLWWAVGAAGLAVAVATVFSLVERHSTVTDTLSQRLLEAALLAVLIMLGETRRIRRAEAERSRREAARLALDRERQANQRLAEQRLQIARDLHDVLAHTLAAATVQASVATDTFDDDPQTSRAAVEVVRQACREAREELAAAVGLLRADALAAGRPTVASREPVPGLAQLDGLLDLVRQAGLKVALHTDGEAKPLPPAVDLTAYRVLQEALTNVVRHSGTDRVEIVLSYRPESLRLRVEDDGPARATDAKAGGYGLMGMRERVVAIGGEVRAVGLDTGGFQVTATLPLHGEARSRA